MNKNKLIVFQDKRIRRTWFNDEWWFVIKDVVYALTESVNPSDYLKKIRKRDKPLANAFKGGGQFVPSLGLEFDTKGGAQMLQCWNTQGIFRLIQSIPSKKAEPFKQWLANVGYERVQEIENPELAQKRMIQLYKAKGYPESWVKKRVRGIIVRDELTDEWKKRDVNTTKEFSILTAEISKATFNMTPKEYRDYKGLNRENLRDHMTDWELILTMIGEKATTDITKETESRGFDECKDSANKGGNIAKRTRKDLEKNLKRKVVSKKNFLDKEKKKKLDK